MAKNEYEFEEERRAAEEFENGSRSNNESDGQLKSIYDDRFAGVLGQDYNLRPLAMPYHDRFQNTVKDVLGEFAKDHQDEPELKVLEAGCGTGLTTIRILEANPKIKVIAVDNEGSTIAQAKEALKDLEDRVDFKQGDILSVLINLEDASIDAFASALTVHNFPKEYREKVLSEVARVLKKNGLFVNADKYALDDPDAHAKSLQEQIDSFDIYDSIGRSDIKKAWTQHYHQDENTRITQQEQIDLLRGLGFKDIEIVFRESMEAVIRAIKK